MTGRIVDKRVCLTVQKLGLKPFHNGWKLSELIINKTEKKKQSRKYCADKTKIKVKKMRHEKLKC